MDGRYSRQELFKPIGKEGQKNLCQSVVTIVGCGALGSAIAETMTRAGVGEIHLVDRDYVELSNLQRQQLFTEKDAEEMKPKVEAAKIRLTAIRSDMRLTTYLQHLDGALMEKLAQSSDLILDATDNFETRLVINDAAAKYDIPWIYGACVGSSGVIFPFVPGNSACFRCLMPVLPSLNETCDTAGIIPSAVQVTAALQCTEALKWLSGNKAAMRSKMHHFNLWDNTVHDLGISRIKNANCETCGSRPIYPALQSGSGGTIAVLCGREAVQFLPNPNRKFGMADALEVGEKLKAQVRSTPYFVEMKVYGKRAVVFADGRILIHGMRNKTEGQKFFHQLFG
ncbi:ThiF family adenylyltransferase [Planomicrobium sp. MB-3u-38]|uniref:ThiF family adenylyltransferase n=1 Tax=Planomicrobium sp. MB-3u-38 TaxID=2058318 RepID=UPI000C7CA873|nr:ThiF family adenylyltransferase [Planomicrobium sp. MB-3u-38]PKH08644.1 thiamine biosynthesis protein ThiF [Planomicrobium sp. MB-3u-38]